MDFFRQSFIIKSQSFRGAIFSWLTTAGQISHSSLYPPMNKGFQHTTFTNDVTRSENLEFAQTIFLIFSDTLKQKEKTNHIKNKDLSVENKVWIVIEDFCANNMLLREGLTLKIEKKNSIFKVNPSLNNILLEKIKTSSVDDPIFTVDALQHHVPQYGFGQAVLNSRIRKLISKSSMRIATDFVLKWTNAAQYARSEIFFIPNYYYSLVQTQFFQNVECSSDPKNCIKMLYL